MNAPATDAEDAPIPALIPEGMPLPQYQCTKIVGALKIKDMEYLRGGSAFLIPEEAGYEPVVVDAGYMLRHQPHVGGYFVVYRDGRQSFSARSHFEDSYVLIAKE